MRPPDDEQVRRGLQRDVRVIRQLQHKVEKVRAAMEPAIDKVLRLVEEGTLLLASHCDSTDALDRLLRDPLQPAQLAQVLLAASDAPVAKTGLGLQALLDHAAALQSTPQLASPVLCKLLNSPLSTVFPLDRTRRRFVSKAFKQARSLAAGERPATFDDPLYHVGNCIEARDTPLLLHCVERLQSDDNWEGVPVLARAKALSAFTVGVAHAVGRETGARDRGYRYFECIGLRNFVAGVLEQHDPETDPYAAAIAADRVHADRYVERSIVPTPIVVSSTALESLHLRFEDALNAIATPPVTQAAERLSDLLVQVARLGFPPGTDDIRLGFTRSVLESDAAAGLSDAEKAEMMVGSHAMRTSFILVRSGLQEDFNLCDAFMNRLPPDLRLQCAGRIAEMFRRDGMGFVDEALAPPG